MNILHNVTETKIGTYAKKTGRIYVFIYIYIYIYVFLFYIRIS